MSITILLVDDHTLTRAGLRNLLESQAGFKVVGEAENGRRAIELARETKPCVVIMDIAMPDVDGVEATRRILEDCPTARIIVLSMYKSKKYVDLTLKSGAAGFLSKDCMFQEVVQAVTDVAAGRSYVSSPIAGIILRGLRWKSVPDIRSEFSLLTPREKEVLQLLAESKTTMEIADRLCITARTVETHRRKIIAKVGIRDAAGLTRLAIREGLVSPDYEP